MLDQNLKMLYAWNNISCKVVHQVLKTWSLEIFSCFVIYFELIKKILSQHLLHKNLKQNLLRFWSFIKRETSDTSSDNEWQQVTSGTTSDNEGQRVAISGNCPIFE